jgi:hypothetical protein
MPQELEQTIKDMPATEAVELFKKITGPARCCKGKSLEN